ncbi:unnamed protein product [Gulo gulo]|uniref:Uncharacterized protein n=1 Tax=Gulo gulo TaxID=48420 RepID=A0A9X9LUN9_GULGU|nr:unnamed protein product [Gulo gulo]
MAFPDSCSKSWGLGLWASVRAQGVLESSRGWGTEQGSQKGPLP